MRFLCVSLCIALPSITMAQDEATRLESLIQDQLSNENQIVTVRGFDGVLSSTATLDHMTIADKDGVWLTLEGAELDWTQSALLRGALKVNTIRADRIHLARLPAPAPVTAEDTAATPITFPSLPVSVEIGQIRANEIDFGEPVFGYAAVFALDGGMSLIDGGGAIEMRLDRIDGPAGGLGISASYVANTGLISLDFNASEAEGGIVSTLFGLPDAPALDLTITGQGATDDFAADLVFAGRGTEHVTGQFVTRVTDETRDITGTLGGDLTPFLAADFHPFFGTSSKIGFTAQIDPLGAVSVPDFTLSTAELSLSGRVEIGEDGRPDQFDVDGILSAENGPVRLPLGTETWVDRANFTAHFDAERSELWQFDTNIHNIEQGEIEIVNATIYGSGVINSAGGNADIEFGTSGIELGDNALNDAVGNTLFGRMAMTWGADAPFQLPELYVNAGPVVVEGAATVDTSTEAITYQFGADVTGTGFDRFSGLVGHNVAGDGTLRVDVSGDVLQRTVDARITSVMTELDLGIPELGALLAGETNAVIDVTRDANGITLRELTIHNDQAHFASDGTVTPSGASLSIDADMFDLALMDLGLSGPAHIDTAATWTKDGLLELAALNLRGAGVAATGSGAADPYDIVGTAKTDLSLSVADLSQFSRLVGRDLSGAINGDVVVNDTTVNAQIATENVSGILGEYDHLIAGNGQIEVDATGTSLDDFTLGNLRLSLPRISATASGSNDAITFDAGLTDVADVVADLSGPASAAGTLRRVGDQWGIDALITALNSAAVRIAGTVSPDNAALDITGNVPLTVANPFISPRSVTGDAALDLRVDGPPALGSVSGRITTAGARFSEPTSGRALTDIGAVVALAAGQATLDINAKVDSGGTVALTGPLTLEAPYNTDLNVTLRDIVLADPTLYQTKIDGALTLSGGLLSNATIAGLIDMGPTELRVPDTLGAASGAIPDGLVHVGETAAVRQTRQAAGLIATASSDDASATTIAMDVTVRAPNQIFLRGRGLDAEMGGEIQLTGTTDNVVPVGAFELIRGRLDFLTERLDLTEGEVRIEGSLDPYILLTAEADTDDVTITVTTEGFVSDPEISFSSSPELPEDEVLAQLIFNSAAAELSALQAIQLANAIATLAGRGGNGIIGNLRESAGLDDLNLSTDAEGNATVEAGKYIAENVYTNVEIDSTGQSQVNLNIDVTNSLTLKGSLGSDGDSSIGAFVERDY